MTINPAYTTDATLPTDIAKVGYADYNDLATIATPLTITGGGGEIVLENDAAGTFTTEAQLPVGVTSVWDEIGDTFDWSELDIGDVVDLRIDLDVITASTNTTVDIKLHLGTGGDAYTLSFLSGQDYKTIGTYSVTTYKGIYLGDTNTRDNGGQFKISADKTCTVTIRGWYVKIVRRGI